MTLSSPRRVVALLKRPHRARKVDVPSTAVIQVTTDHLYMVVNAGCREKDLAHLNKHLASFKARKCACF